MKEDEDAHRQVAVVGEEPAEVMDVAAGLHPDKPGGNCSAKATNVSRAPTPVVSGNPFKRKHRAFKVAGLT